MKIKGLQIALLEVVDMKGDANACGEGVQFVSD
jgi:hypothetical protein